MKILITALLLFMGSSVFAQVNYVLNPDFEQKVACPVSYDQISRAKYWSGIDTLLSGTELCVPEYCHSCAVNTDVGIPNGQGWWQYARSGYGFANVRITAVDSGTNGNTGPRDYLQGRLYKQLKAGRQYCVSFYVNLAEASDDAIADIGAYLDNGSIDTTSNCSAAQVKCSPQIVNTSGVITDTANWVKIAGSFVANGTEQFITIGNYKYNAHTTYVKMPDNPLQGAAKGTYYLVDDVSVIESDLKADAGPDTHVGKGDSVYIGRSSEVGLECTWSVLGSSAVIGTGAGIWVKPAATTSYVVTQTLCGNVKKDTVRVEVWAAGMHSVNGQTQQYTLSPNPSDGRIQLLQTVADDRAVQLEVFDFSGRRVYDSNRSFNDGRLSVDLAHIAAGAYYIVLRDHVQNTFSMKFIRK